MAKEPIIGFLEALSRMLVKGLLLACARDASTVMEEAKEKE